MTAKGCPGAGEYGHGLAVTIVHAGDCCHQWRERVIGYMDALGYVRCVECAGCLSMAWEPMRAYNLASDADECDGCHKRLVEAGLRYAREHRA